MLRHLFLKLNFKRRFLIWVRFNHEKELVKRTLWNFNLEEYSNKSRELFIDDKIDGLICHPKSAGEGVNLSHAKYSFFLSFDDSSITMEQAFNRMSSYKGKKNKHIYLFTPNNRHPDIYNKTIKPSIENRDKDFEDRQAVS